MREFNFINISVFNFSLFFCYVLFSMSDLINVWEPFHVHTFFFPLKTKNLYHSLSNRDKRKNAKLFKWIIKIYINSSQHKVMSEQFFSSFWRKNIKTWKHKKPKNVFIRISFPRETEKTFLEMLIKIWFYFF